MSGDISLDATGSSRSGTADRVPAMVTWLGRAGLTPFIAAALLVLYDPGTALTYREWIGTYALAILSFLVGAWWGLSLLRRDTLVLLAGNAVVVIAFLGNLLLPVEGYLVLAALLFAAVLAVEHAYVLFQPAPAYYRALRVRLTLVAVACLLVCVVC